jgi:hypothetical protein
VDTTCEPAVEIVCDIAVSVNLFACQLDARVRPAAALQSIVKELQTVEKHVRCRTERRCMHTHLDNENDWLIQVNVDSDSPRIPLAGASVQQRRAVDAGKCKFRSLECGSPSAENGRRFHRNTNRILLQGPAFSSQAKEPYPPRCVLVVRSRGTGLLEIRAG